MKKILFFILMFASLSSFAQTQTSRAILYTYFKTGAFPTQAQFYDLIASQLNLSNDAAMLMMTRIYADTTTMKAVNNLEDRTFIYVTGNKGFYYFDARDSTSTLSPSILTSVSPSIGGTSFGRLKLGRLNAESLLDGSVSTLELSYLDGVTFGIQQQINAKADTLLVNKKKTVSVTSAQVLAANATPVSLLSAIADTSYIVKSISIYNLSGSTDYSTNTNLEIKIGSGVLATIDLSGLPTTGRTYAVASYDLLENTALVAQTAIGEATAGNKEFDIIIEYEKMY